MSLDGWIRLAMDGFDYISSTITENQTLANKTVAASPIVVRNPPKGKYTASTDGIIELANYEGLSNTVYLDSGGVRTIGIGMTTSEIADLKSWAWDRIIPTIDCVRMFVEAIEKYEDAINGALKVAVSQNEFDALLSITYNIGIGRVADSKHGASGMLGSTFMKRLNMGDTHERVAEAMTWWNQDNGKVVQGLVNRRAAEKKIFLGGAYQNNGTVAHITVDPNTHKPKYNARVNIEQYL